MSEQLDKIQPDSLPDSGNDLAEKETSRLYKGRKRRRHDRERGLLHGIFVAVLIGFTVLTMACAVVVTIHYAAPASSASDKFEIDSIETYTAFLAGFEAAQSESKPTLPFRLPSEAPPVGHATMVLVIRNGRYVRRCQSQFAMKGEQEAGCHDRHLYMPYEWEDSVMAWMEEEAFLASFELWKKQKEGAE